MGPARSLSLDRCAPGEARSRSRRCRVPGVRGELSRQARGDCGFGRGRPHPCRSGRALRRHRRIAGAARFLCRSALCGQHHRSGAGEILRRRARPAHRRLLASFVLHARAQPDRGRRARAGAGRSAARALPAVVRGHPQGAALSARGPRRAAVPREIGHSRAWHRLFDETLASLRFNVEGVELAIEPTLNLLQDESEKKRRAAAEALAETFRANLRLFTLITLAKDKEITDRWRGFPDVAFARHLSNRVEPEVVDALVAAVRAAFPKLSHRYYALKARWFGKTRLPHWDRNAPLPKVKTRTIDWTEAKRTVLDAYAKFSPHMAEIAERFFAKNWMDAPVRPGKAPGAFAHPTVPSVHPYVLLNYQGKPRDVMTLAHELGHGVHQVLAAPNGPLMAPTPLTLAETASVFGEMLTFRALLANITDKEQRRAMLAAKVEDMVNTVVRQIAFYGFERRVHVERKDGELTAERLGEVWRA